MSDSRGGRRPRGGGWLLVALVVLTGLSPAAARAQTAQPDSVSLTWTAPGDDGSVGTGSAFELRSSTTPIDESNWGSASTVPGTPAPLVAGTRQRMVVRGLTYGTTYYFAIKTVDNAGNWSDLSNLLQWNWTLSSAPPSAPKGVNGRRRGNRHASLAWTPNSEPDLAGYTVYRATTRGGPFTRLNAALLTVSEYEDAAVPEGADKAWYEVTATDIGGNESAHSSTVEVSLVEVTTAWAMEPGYPNPSPAGAPVRIPLVAPTAGGTARIEIFTNAGQRVRSLDLGTVAAGAQTVTWDGRNEGGREVAAGVYTAWLTAGSSRIAIRLVRVP